jgi:FlaA1/EpsC-like NDP-sugar epimerase
MSKISVAVGLERFDADLGQVTPIRFFEGHVHRLLLLAAMEAAVIVLSIYGAVLVRFPDSPEVLAALDITVGATWIKPFLITAVMLLGLASMGLYQLRQRIGFSAVLARLCIAVLIAEAVLGLIFYLWPAVFVGRGVLALAGAFSLAGLALTRYAFQRIVDEDVFKRRVLVWGAGARAAAIAARLRRRTDQRGF